MVPAEVYRQFKVLSAEFGMTSRQAVMEALALLFRKYGKEPPEQLTDARGASTND